LILWRDVPPQDTSGSAEELRGADYYAHWAVVVQMLISPAEQVRGGADSVRGGGGGGGNTPLERDPIVQSFTEGVQMHSNCSVSWGGNKDTGAQSSG
jgi:hypothetical protein